MKMQAILQRHELKYIIIGCLFLAALGFWQLQRAAYKRELVQKKTAQASQPAVALESLSTPGLYQKVNVSGEYLNHRTILLDNQIQQHQIGYVIFSVLQLADGSAVLVRREWIKRRPSRAQLPKVQAITGRQTLTARIALPEKRFVLGSIAEDNKWPRVVQAIDLSQISEWAGLPLKPYILRLDDWQVVNIGPERHIGYAVQWFALALVLLMGYIIYAKQ